jgi:phage gpG-like protein
MTQQGVYDFVHNKMGTTMGLLADQMEAAAGIQDLPDGLTLTSSAKKELLDSAQKVRGDFKGFYDTLSKIGNSSPFMGVEGVTSAGEIPESAARVLSSALGQVMDKTTDQLASVLDAGTYEGMLQSLRSGSIPQQIGEVSQIASATQHMASGREGKFTKELQGMSFPSIDVPYLTGEQSPTNSKSRVKSSIAAENKANASAAPGEFKSLLGKWKNYWNASGEAGGIGKMNDLFDESIEVLTKNKMAVAVAGGAATLFAASHVVGGLSGRSASSTLNDAPLPPNTPLDDGMTGSTPSFDVAPGAPTVRVAQEMPALNSTDLRYNGSGLGGALSDEFNDVVNRSSTFVHDDRGSLSRQGMIHQRQESSSARF